MSFPHHYASGERVEPEMMGEEGIEPSLTGIRNQRLTTWLLPFKRMDA